MSELQFECVSLARGGQMLLTDLSLRLGSGESAVVRGPNGAGKTTLLRAAAGLSRPAAGRIVCNGEDTFRLPAEVRAEVWYFSHQLGLKRELTIDENLGFWAAMTPNPAPVADLLGRVGLAGLGDRIVGSLSAGQRRRAALARLGLGMGGVWLLDEPLTNLDSQGSQVVGELIFEHLQRQGIALIATHQPLTSVKPQFEVELGP